MVLSKALGIFRKDAPVGLVENKVLLPECREGKMQGCYGSGRWVGESIRENLPRIETGPQKKIEGLISG